MKRALIIGASGGIGAALTTELEGRSVTVTGLSRSKYGLDLRNADSVERVLADCSGPYDLVFIATGVLAASGKRPEKSLDQIDADAMAEVMLVNTVGVAQILRHVPRLLPKTGRCVVAALTARVGSIGDNHLGGWYSYRASKAAANQILRTAAIEIRRKHKEAIVVALHPGTVATSFTEAYQGYDKATPQVTAEHLLRVLDDLSSSDTGRFFDWAGQEVPW